MLEPKPFVLLPWQIDEFREDSAFAMPTARQVHETLPFWLRLRRFVTFCSKPSFAVFCSVPE